ncbi:MAG: hypothetical protein LBG49_00785 [Mycoplasmataceae bacterium]|jgi:hypothetical protein|nr:hypothetical protein [Mycoplasmataceae bacterium]
MYKAPPIIYDDSLIRSIVNEIINRTPGINTVIKPKITISSDKSIITIAIAPLSSINNVLNIATTLQINTINTLKKNMDVHPKQVNVQVISEEHD